MLLPPKTAFNFCHTAKKSRLGLQGLMLITVGTLLLSACTGLFYYPDSRSYLRPEMFHLTYTSEFIQDQEKNNIHFWWFPSQTQKTKGTILFFHGNAENISSHFLNLAWIPQNGYAFLIFDYPGYGKSSGKPSPKSTVQAGVAVAKWLHRHQPNIPLFFYGQSLGGIVAMRVAIESKPEIPISALVIDSSFASYRQVGQAILKKSWFTWPFQWLAWFVLSDEWSPNLSELAEVPILVIHGAADHIVPPIMSEEIFAMAKSPKIIWQIPNSDHGQTFFIENGLYRQKFLDYLGDHK